MTAKNNNKDNDNSKALLERYKRVLGKDTTPWQHKKVNKKPVPWFIWILMVLGPGLSIQYLFNIMTQSTDKLKVIPTQQEDNQTTAEPQILLPIPRFENATPINKVIVSGLDGTEDRTAETGTSEDFDSDKSPKISDQFSVATDNIAKNESPKDKQFLVVVESTTSKNEAITSAKLLSTSGYPSKVILSSTGYFGVVLGSFNFETANTTMDNVITSGVVTSKPYIMSVDRVKDYISVDDE